MPGEDGLAALRDLRGGGSVIPVVLLTARGEVIDRIVGIEMGADDYLAKPVDLRELEARIKAVLRRPARAAEPTPAPQRPALAVRQVLARHRPPRSSSPRTAARCR